MLGVRPIQKRLRRYPEQALEVTREMALIGKAHLIRDFADGGALPFEEFFRPSRSSVDHIAIWRLARRLFKETGEVIGAQVNRSGNGGNGQVGMQLLLNKIDGGCQLLSG